MKFVLRTSEVKFAHHFAVRRNFTHKVNFTIEDNFTCPKGKLSFSVFSVKDNTLIRQRLFVPDGAFAPPGFWVVEPSFFLLALAADFYLFTGKKRETGSYGGRQDIALGKYYELNLGSFVILHIFVLLWN